MKNHSFQQQGASKLVVDPVCGMQIDPARAAATLEWRGQNIHFCSSHCTSKFRNEPGRYPLVPDAPKSTSGHCERCG
jgi:P-type Cu+ transporter